MQIKKNGGGWWVLLGIAGMILCGPAASAHTDVSSAAAKAMIDSNSALIVVDVREVSEYCGTLEQIPGALNYPYSSGVLAARYDELAVGAEILLYCHGGNRSNSAANFLDSKGFTHIYDMLGGISGWLYDTVGCIDSDGDAVNDDLDNCPQAYNPSQADSDSDGLGNVCDWDCGDFDGSNPVSWPDFATLASEWEEQGPHLSADLNADMKVDTLDLAIFANYWLCSCYE